MMAPRTCTRCGQSIDHLRADAKFCGATCKKAARRARQAALDDPASSRFDAEARFLWFSAPGADAIERADLEFALVKALMETNGVVHRRPRRERVAA